MQYLTIVDNSYEEAVKRAKSLYGENIRIHSRRDFLTQGGLFTRRLKKCEIICYLSDNPRQDSQSSQDKDLSIFEKEARTPDPDTLTVEERLDSDVHRRRSEGYEEATRLLDKNHISGPFREKLLSGFAARKDEVGSILSERIVKETKIDYKTQAHPNHYMVFIGPTGTGKTTTLAKVAHLYASQGKRVAIITLDSYRIGAYEQIKAFGEALSIPVDLAKAEDELLISMEKYAWFDLVLVDTMGISHKDIELNLRLKGLTALLDQSRTTYVFTVSPSMKEEDLVEHYLRYSQYNPTALVATKLDETETIGNVLSFADRTGLQLLFFTDGQKVPEDLEKASTSVILDHLKGFGLDIKTSKSQISKGI